jgi:surfactin synthase thioesterase subunit
LYHSLKLLALLEPNEPPLIFFGHSYGGLIAYELSLLLLHREGFLLPHLIVSSTNNPLLLAARAEAAAARSYQTDCSQSNQQTATETEAKRGAAKTFHRLSDEALLEEMVHHGGLPVGVHIDILRHMLPVIRGDYEGLETYSPPPSLSHSDSACACESESDNRARGYPGYLTVLGSEDDPGDVSESSLLGWRRHSLCPEQKFSFHLFPSQSHFYFAEAANASAFFDTIREICSRPLQSVPFPV